MCTVINPLVPESDWHLISPFNITLQKEGNDHKLKNLLIVIQILLVSTLGNVWRTVWRICILKLRCKGLKTSCNQFYVCIVFLECMIVVSASA